MTSPIARIRRRLGLGRTARRPAPSTEEQSKVRGPRPRPRSDRMQAEQAALSTVALLESEVAGTAEDPVATTPGPAFSRRTPYLVGLLGALGVFTGWGLVLLLGRLEDVITLVVVALFLALGLDPAVGRLHRHGLGRGWAVLVVLLAVLALVAAFVWIVVPPIVSQADQLIRHTPGYLSQLQDSRWFQDTDAKWHLSDKVVAELKAHVNQDTVLAILGGVLGVTARVVDSVTQVVTTLILTILVLATLPQLKAAAYTLVPASRRVRVVYLTEEVLSRVGAYLLGQVTVAVVNAVFCYTLLLALGLPFPVILSLTVGVLALVPIVGTLVAGVLVTSIAATHGLGTATIALAYFVLYHLLETYVIAPRVMKRAVEVPPLVTIVAVLAGSAVAGVLGALLAIPVTAGVLLVCRQVVVPRQQAH